MRLSRKVIVKLELNEREIGVLRNAYVARYPVADTAWFRRQCLEREHSFDEIMSWLQVFLDEKKAQDKVEQEIALALYASIAQRCENERDTKLLIVSQKPYDLEEADITIPVSFKEKQVHYPRCLALGIDVRRLPGTKLDYVPRQALQAGLQEQDFKIPNFSSSFHRFFGIQTMCAYGPYAHDVESVLERLFSGELTGSQLLWD